MDIIRHGNDINVTWSVFGRNGLKYSLTGAVYRLWLVQGPSKKQITSYTIQARNQLVFTIDDSDLDRCGAYRLVLQVREPGVYTEDAAYDLVHVFQIVSESYPMATNKSLNGKCDIVINSTLKDVYISTLEGASAYEIAVKNGFEGNESEWLLSLIGIQSMEQTQTSTESGGLNKLAITLADGSVTELSFYNGAQGAAGASTLAALTDVSVSSPSSGQVLTWNGSRWVNANGGGYSYGQGINISGSNVISADFPAIAAGLIALGYSLDGGEGGGSGASSLAGLSDVYLMSPQDGQVLAYDGATSRWKAKTLVIPEGGSTPDIPSDLSAYVTKAGVETITGAKTFTAPTTLTDTLTVGTTAGVKRIYFGDTAHYLELNSNGYYFYGAGVYTDSFVSAGGLSPSSSGDGETGATRLAELTDVDLVTDAPQDGQVLKYSYDPALQIGKWIPSTISSGGGTSSGPKVFYGVSSSRPTTSNTLVEVTCPEFTAEDLVEGTILAVSMANTAEVSGGSVYLNVNGTGREFTTNGSSTIAWNGGEVVLFIRVATGWKVLPTNGYLAWYVDTFAGGGTVSFSQTLTSGTEIGRITINGTTTRIFAPSGSGGSGSSVSVSPVLTTGTLIARITVDGTTKNLYAPTGSGGSDTPDLSGYVTLSTTQTIDGSKTFSSQLKLTDTLIVGQGASSYAESSSSAKKRIYFGDTTHYIELNENGYYFHGGGLYTNSFITAGGISTTKGFFSLNDLLDVSIESTPGEGQLLGYNAETMKWEPLVTGTLDTGYVLAYNSSQRKWQAVDVNTLINQS